MLEHFVAGTTARTASTLFVVNKSTSGFYFHRLRELIYLQCEAPLSEQFAGKIELDESYFSGSRKGLRGRRAAGKVPVFGIFKREGRVFTKIIPYASSKTLI